MSYNDETTGFDGVQNEPNFKEILFKYLIHWKWFAVSVIIAAFLGYTFLRVSTPLYKVETDLLIKDNKGNLGGQNDLLKDLNMFSSDKIIDNEVQILRSNTLLEKTVKGLNLQTSYFSTRGVRRHEIYEELPFKVELLKPAEHVDYTTVYQMRLLSPGAIEINGKSYPTGKAINIKSGLVLVTPAQSTAYQPKEIIEVQFSDIIDVIDKYSENLKIAPVSKQGTVLIITIEAAVPAKGKDFLNRLVYEYNLAAVQDKNKVTSTTLSFITDRLNKLQEELGSAEKKVENYKSGNKNQRYSIC